MHSSAGVSALPQLFQLSCTSPRHLHTHLHSSVLYLHLRTTAEYPIPLPGVPVQSRRHLHSASRPKSPVPLRPAETIQQMPLSLPLNQRLPHIVRFSLCNSLFANSIGSIPMIPGPTFAKVPSIHSAISSNSSPLLSLLTSVAERLRCHLSRRNWSL